MFQLRARLTNLFLASLDTLVTFTCFFMTVYYQGSLPSLGPLSPGEAAAVSPYLLVVLLPAWSLSFAYFRLYHSRRTDSCFSDTLILLQGICLGTAVLGGIKIFYEPLPLSREFLVPFLILNFTTLTVLRVCMRLLLRRLRRQGLNVKKLLIVGIGPLVEQIVEKIEAHPFYGYKILGVLGSRPGKSRQGIAHLGEVADFSACIEEYPPEEVIIALPFEHASTIQKIVSVCEARGIHARVAPDLFKIVKPQAQIHDLDGIPLINARVYPTERVEYLFLKRAFDIIVSLFCLIVLAPMMVLLAVGIKMTSAGRVIFRQERVGLNGKRFWMYKFRTMRSSVAGESDTRWTRPRDERVIPFGRLLRRTSLDELPQLLNVLKGDMSMVEPRPERPHFVEIFKHEIPDYMVRHYMKCGITGWAQVNGWRGDTSIRKRIEFDLYYMQHWALGLDIKILLLTLARGFYHRNAC